MKKLFTMMAAAVVAVSASAQTVTESKTFDNFYVGINGGVGVKTTGHAWMKNLDPNAGLRIGRWFTPVFGLAAESNVYFSNKPAPALHTTARLLNTSLLATVNLSNWFAGYKGEPRAFEVIPVYGFGWGHTFGSTTDQGLNPNAAYTKKNMLTSKAGIDFAFNLGESKAWQVYVEPAMLWTLNGLGHEGLQYNINRSAFQLNAGLVYKFGNSNGTHNFKIADKQINDLRNELAKKPKEVVKTVVKEAPAPQPVKVENLVFVTFAQGKADLTKAAKKALNAIAAGSHVEVVGTASPEGSAEINQKISQMRADNVASYLKSKGVIVDEANGKGVQGTTSNRLAVVYVK